MVAVAASTHGRRRGEALAFFLFSPRRTVYVQLGVKMIVFQGVLMVSPAPHAARASLSCGFQGVSSVTAPTARASSFGFQIPFDSTMRWRTGTSAEASSTTGPRGLRRRRVDGVSAEETRRSRRWRAGGVNSQTPSTRDEGRRYSTRVRDDVPADVPTFRGVAAPIGRRPRLREELDEPVVPRRGNHRPRAVPHYPFGMLRHGQTMERLAS